jgi:chemotaxis regulatin CheY-phosphate phosphatase CheZ
MTSRNTSELLYDSEAALRLVDSAIAEMHHVGSVRTHESGARAPGLVADPTLIVQTGALDPATVSRVLARGYAEIVSVLGSLRESRSVLERDTVDHLRQTSIRLREVSSATETAATSIMAGLERSVAIIDDLDAMAAAGDASGAAERRTTLRDQLFELIGCMQFQDIAAQQLDSTSSVLSEIESRLAQLAVVLDPGAFATTTPERLDRSANETTSPAAVTERDASHQALADEVFNDAK